MRCVVAVLVVSATLLVAGEPKPAPVPAPAPAPVAPLNFDEQFPSKATPWKPELVKAQGVAFKAYIEALHKIPVEKVVAHAAGSDFPGAVAKEAERVKRTVAIDLSTTGLHSTGLYAAPGEKITVTVRAGFEKAKIDVRIGCHQDQLWKKDNWLRVPQIIRRYPITGTSTAAANAFGGPVYILVNEAQAGKTLDATIENAVAAPWYVLGKTDIAEWKEKIRLAPAPFAELQSKHMILSLQSDVVRKLDNPEELMQFWDKLVEATNELAGKPTRAGHVRIVFDRQISVGYMHSGYPIMCPLNEAKNAASLDEMKKGTWGFYHEIGHNHQHPRDWTFDGTVKVTCNLFSLYCLEKVLGLPRDGHPSIKPKPRERALKNYFKDGGHFEDWKLDPFLALFMYMQMIDAFGWEPFKTTFAEYRDLTKEQRPKNDDEKRDQWLMRMSKNTGKNLGPFFEVWKVPTSEAARKSVAHLPEWMPEKDFPAKYKEAVPAPAPAVPGVK